jgi:cytochrome c oxidase subunit 4
MPHNLAYPRVYGIVYVALLLLLVLTVGAAQHDLGRWNFAVAGSIAGVKAFLIVLYFMHVRGGTALVKLVIAAALLWLLILFALSLADYWTRGWI